MEEETKVRSNAAPAARWGKTRIVVTGGVGGIAGMVILGGALAVANMIKNVSSSKRIPDTTCNDANQDAPACSEPPASSCREEGGQGLPCLLPTPECIDDEQDASGITPDKIGCPEQDTTVPMPNSIQDDVDIAAADENFLVSMEDEASVITNTTDIEEENHHVPETPPKEDENVSSPDQGLEDIPSVKVVVVAACEHLSRIEHNVLNATQINGYYNEMKQIDTQSEEDRSTNEDEHLFICNSNTKQDAPRTIGDYSPDPDALETPIQEDRSSMEFVVEQLFCCNGTTEHEAVIMTQIDNFYPEPEMPETPIKEERLENALDIKENNSTYNEHEADDYYQVEEESSHEQVKIEPENLGTRSARAAGDAIKDEISVMVSKESVDIDESSVTCDCIKEETKNEDDVLLKEDPSSPLKEETQSEDDQDEEMEDSEGTPDSSTESNSEAIWPVESKEEELLLSKDRAQEEKLYKETSQNDVEEAGFVTMSSDMGTGMELRSRPSKIFSRGGFLVWFLLVVGLMFLLFASDLPMSYHLNNPQLSSS